MAKMVASHKDALCFCLLVSSMVKLANGYLSLSVCVPRCSARSLRNLCHSYVKRFG
ncbi:hypothetical protein PF005_g11242 [Phytophthora fragariae]|uniref:Secreted protein n=1 Tax=Phytophthora fragariae TaxID=53985 RepID=A0A6A4DBV2_9STRA|nr:hypothetical protein PF003_g14080 [Phytophthora fragariae]KAE8932861.1 hypothetical protein PF009_g17116 [Phytophthora fragariae]KAE8999138.1 hypothetical protein PF011_g14755 [Phytophthora fragariae]KAE9086360.1 hypothetical protein PF010_g20117 [Phytophthora fragariae]KAE9099110.1 hypothetical protein PF007_g16007 [Phytophthora fragariae]